MGVVLVLNKRAPEDGKSGITITPMLVADSTGSIVEMPSTRANLQRVLEGKFNSLTT